MEAHNLKMHSRSSETGQAEIPVSLEHLLESSRIVESRLGAADCILERFEDGLQHDCLLTCEKGKEDSRPSQGDQTGGGICLRSGAFGVDCGTKRGS